MMLASLINLFLVAFLYFITLKSDLPEKMWAYAIVIVYLMESFLEAPNDKKVHWVRSLSVVSLLAAILFQGEKGFLFLMLAEVVAIFLCTSEKQFQVYLKKVSILLCSFLPVFFYLFFSQSSWVSSLLLAIFIGVRILDWPFTFNSLESKSRLPSPIYLLNCFWVPGSCFFLLGALPQTLSYFMAGFAVLSFLGSNQVASGVILWTIMLIYSPLALFFGAGLGLILWAGRGGLLISTLSLFGMLFFMPLKIPIANIVYLPSIVAFFAGRSHVLSNLKKQSPRKELISLSIGIAFLSAALYLLYDSFVTIESIGWRRFVVPCAFLVSVSLWLWLISSNEKLSRQFASLDLSRFLVPALEYEGAIRDKAAQAPKHQGSLYFPRAWELLITTLCLGACVWAGSVI